MTPEFENFLFFLIYIFVGFLIFNSGIHDVITALATLTGTRSFPFRAILCTIILSSIPSYFILQSTNSQHQMWLNLFPNIAVFPSSEELLYFTLSAVFFTSIPTALGLFLNHPSFITPSMLSFFLGYFFFKKDSTTPNTITTTTTFNYSLRTGFLSFLIIPLISGCITWCVNRVFIRGILYADRENRLKRSLSWCAFIYPVTASISITAVLLRYLSFNSTLPSYIIDLICIAALLFTFTAAYFSFKVFFSAWLKRRVFLLYPQEYSYYMERCERVDQGDREARGLGPIQNYYSSRNSLPHSYNQSSKTESIDSQSINMNLSNNSAQFIESGVTAGRNALNMKRTEELFRPALVLLSLSTIITVAPTESLNLLSLFRVIILTYGHESNDDDIRIPFPYFIVAFISMLLGPIFFTRRCCSFTGKEIIKSMSPSQGFSIQFGTLLTLLIAILLRLPTLPILYLMINITAVGSTTDEINNNTLTLPSDLMVEKEKLTGAFRRNISKIFLFWLTCTSFSFLAGYFSAQIIFM